MNFVFQLSARESELQQHLAQEWESHINAMENQLQQRIDQCHTLHTRLTEGLHSMEARERSVSLREESVSVCFVHDKLISKLSFIALDYHSE